MKILLTGATGYIAKRLLPVLLEHGHEVICAVRDLQRFDLSRYAGRAVSAVAVDFLDAASLQSIPDDIDAAYFLIHSMSAAGQDFAPLEATTAENFRDRISQTRARQVIYLGGIVNEEKLSKHLRSRKRVEEILSGGRYALTSLRAGIIVGSGSASFEIIRDLVEKLPLMIAPRWLDTRSQPIAIRNVIELLHRVLLRPEFFGQSFDIGGPDVLSYKEMLLRFAKVRGLKRAVYTVPVMTPKLSSYWLYFVTSTSYPLAVNLVDSMKVEVICRSNSLMTDLGVRAIPYEEAIALAFDKIEQNQVISSWKDAMTRDILPRGISTHIQVPVYGCFRDLRRMKTEDPQAALDRIWRIGGANGWYYGNRLWQFRGFLDKLVGGVGLRRGRRSPSEISAGESLDFWRVLLADRQEGRLLLYAEMKLPGEAWLEFRLEEGHTLVQTATFRPRGLLGRLYWFAVLPFHGLIFQGMLKAISRGDQPRRSG